MFKIIKDRDYLINNFGTVLGKYSQDADYIIYQKSYKPDCLIILDKCLVNNKKESVFKIEIFQSTGFRFLTNEFLRECEDFFNNVFICSKDKRIIRILEGMRKLKKVSVVCEKYCDTSNIWFYYKKEIK